MQVHFFATLRQVVGGKTVEVPGAAGGTVAALLDTLLASYPGLRPHLYNPEGELYPHIHVFVNGRDARWLAHGLDTVLGPGDNVSIFPPVGGGCGQSLTACPSSSVLRPSS